jgi:hypothetical protein
VPTVVEGRAFDQNLGIISSTMAKYFFARNSETGILLGNYTHSPSSRVLLVLINCALIPLLKSLVQL